MSLLGPLQQITLAGVLFGNLLAVVAVVQNSPPIMFAGLGVIALALLPATFYMAWKRLRSRRRVA